MGCLKVHIEPVSKGLSVDMNRIGGLSVVWNIIKRTGKCICAFLREISDIVTNISVVNDETKVVVAEAYPPMTVSLGITCLTNLDDECYLELLDGYMITLEGCYVKVLKK